jgi:hypothetical protein
MPSSRFNRAAASWNRAAAAIQGFFSLSWEMETVGVCVGTLEASKV